MAAADTHAEHGAAGRAEVQPVPLHAHGYSFDVGNIRTAQSHHVRRAGLLHLRRPAVLRVCAGERAGQHRKQRAGDKDRRAAREFDVTSLDELWQRYAPIRLYIRVVRPFYSGRVTTLCFTMNGGDWILNRKSARFLGTCPLAQKRLMHQGTFVFSVWPTILP